MNPRTEATKSLHPFVKTTLLTTALTNIITTDIDKTAGISLRILLTQKFFKSIVCVSSISVINILVIKKPDSTKKTVTPNKPLLAIGSFK